MKINIIDFLEKRHLLSHSLKTFDDGMGRKYTLLEILNEFQKEIEDYLHNKEYKKFI